MSDSAVFVVEVSPVWALLAAALLAVLAVGAAGLVAVASDGRRGVGVPLWEGARLLRQSRRTTLEADNLLWRTGGWGLGVVALLMVAVVPLGRWVIADLPVGVVWFNAMDVVVWALVWLLGWGANSHFSLIGGYRFLGQALAYELPLMFALVAPATAAGSLRVGDVVAAQQSLWYAVWMPVAFIAFCVCVAGFSVWGPFSLPAAPGLGGGVLAELSGIDRLAVLAGRYLLLAAGAAFAVATFLGGGAGPLLPGWAWSLVKTALLLAVLVLAGRRLPAIRPERFAELGWLVLLPATLVQLLVVAVVVARG